jgi:YD repeat-containing protein
MLSFNDKNITYDNNGNMTLVTNSCGTSNYTWDVRNRLIGIQGYKPDCSPLSASFEYDALGRRIEKMINGITIQYLYDGLDIVQEIENGLPSVNG